MKTQLRAWRKKAKLTQPQAAKTLGVPFKSYERWELGTDQPAGKNLRILLTKLNLDIHPFVGRRLQQYRLAEHLTQRAAAAKLGISQSFVAKLEKDQQRCPAPVLRKLNRLAPAS